MTAELLPCPFCGGESYQLQIGNERSKSRGFDTGCKNCHITLSNRVFRKSLDWCRAKSTGIWNTRTPDLSFLDKPDVVESVARFIDDYNCEDAKTIGGDYYEAWKEVRTYPDAHKMYKTRCLKMAEYVVEAIKRMAKEGK